MMIRDQLHKEYFNILNKNNLTELDFKNVFTGKEPGLRFKFDDDLEFITFYIGCESISNMIEIGQIKIASLFQNMEVDNYDTIQIMLISLYLLDRLVGTQKNILRNNESTAIDKGITESVRQYIFSHFNLFCKIVSKYTNLNLTTVDVQCGEISKKLIDTEEIFAVFNKEILIIFPLKNKLQIINTLSSKSVFGDEFFKTQASVDELNQLIDMNKYEKILIATS